MDQNLPFSQQITLDSQRQPNLSHETQYHLNLIYISIFLILMEGPERERTSKFQLNKTDISKLGFDLTSDKPLYHQFISPYEEDQQRPHPLITEIPEGFTAFTFQFDKVNNRLVEDTFIYIFYNVIDQRLQLQAGRNLMDKGLNYHRKYKIWVRKKENKFEYFNISQWKFIDFNEPVIDEDYYTKEDFAEKISD